MIGPQPPQDDERTQDVLGQDRLIQRKVRSICLSLGLQQADHEDVSQDLRCELYRRSRWFRTKRGCWDQFAATVIDRCAASILRRYARQHAWAPIAIGGEDARDLVAHASANNQSVEDALAFRETLSRLTEEQRRIVDALISYPKCRVAEVLGIPRSTLYRRIKEIALVLCREGVAPRNSENLPNKWDTFEAA